MAITRLIHLSSDFLGTICSQLRCQISLNKQNFHTNKTLMSIERLADVLIASRCGTHSLGLVYEFLLKAHGSPKQARADFVSYLSGELPARLLKEARLWVAEEQGCKAPTLIDEDDLVELPGDSSLVPQAQSNSPYVPIQASWHYETAVNAFKEV
jgi:hypothetical protein